MDFRRLALNSVKRNAIVYSSYLLSSSFSIFIFFTYSMLYFHPALKDIYIKNTRFALVCGEILLFCFSSLFLLYSIKSFLKVRKQELGILKVVGIESTHFKRFIYVENSIVCFFSLLSGMGLGCIFSKLFFKIVEKLVNLKALPLYIPWEAIGLTITIFPILFLIVSLFTISFAHQKHVLTLLQSADVPEAQPRSSILLSILSLGCLSSAIYLLKSPISLGFLDSMDRLFYLFIVLVALGNYLMFTQLSMFVIGLLRNHRNLLWRGPNLFTISGMAFKIKDFAWILFMMTMITIMACAIWMLELIYTQQYSQLFSVESVTSNANNLIIFIAIFVATIFSILSAYLLYFKLYNILCENNEIFVSLHRIGFNSLEMIQATTVQMTLLFFTPLLISSLEIVISLYFMNPTWKAFFQIHTPLSIIIPIFLKVILAFFTVQFIFFSITRSRYLNHLKRIF